MLIDEVVRIAEKHRDKTIVVGLSGGADSVTLTHALKTCGFSVVAAHVNHCLRGEESDGDEKFVREFCEGLNIPLFVKRADVAVLAKEHGIGLEAEGRRVRYEFFESVPFDNKIIATAHNKDDAAETVLMNLIRGSGGLRGIPERNDIIRPLINVPRAEIEQYCKNNGLGFRTDSSNLRDDYTRNKIRHIIMPELKRINPSAEDAILRAAEVSRLDRQTAEAAAETVKAEKRGDRWYVSSSDMPDGMLYRVIRNLYEKVRGTDKDLSFENVRAAAVLAKSGKTGRVAELGKGVCLETVYGGFLIGKLPEKREFCKLIKGKTVFEEAGLWVNVWVSKKMGGRISFDAYAVGEIYGRSRKNGDRIRLNRHEKKLKSVLIDKKISAEIRDKMIVLVGKCGIVGVIGLGFDKTFVANDKTVKFLNADWGEYNE